MNQTDLQALLVKRLDDIQNKISDIGERLGTIDGKIIAIQEKISSLEEKTKTSENEGRILRGKQQENEIRFSDVAREISAIRSSMERQEGEIKRIKEEIGEIKENARPLMILSDALSRFHKSLAYAAVVFVIVGAFYFLFSGKFDIIHHIIETLAKLRGSR